MEKRRQRRLGDFIQEELGELLSKKLQDPRLSRVTITGVETSPDYRLAKVWFSVLGEEQEIKEATAALQGAAGFLRRELAAVLHMRYTPELTFKLDESWQRGARVDALLNQIAQGTAETGKDLQAETNRPKH